MAKLTDSNRRGLLQSAAGVAATVLAAQPASAKAPPRKSPPVDKAFGLPGPYPGKVVELHDPRSVQQGRIDASVAAAMLSKGITTLTGAATDADAWRSFFKPGDRVGLKVNCVGHPVKDPAKHAVYTSHEMIRAIVDKLRAIGIKDRDILLFDRYRMEFTIAGYPDLAKSLGIPWEVSAISWDQTQIDMDGYSAGDPNAAATNGKARTDGSPRPSGYDPDVFVAVDFVHPLHDPANPRTRRSHVAKIVTQKVDKIINLCLVKDHAAAGITGALKNLSHGLVDNVCRSHSRSSLNQTSTFIPAVLSLPVIRQKVVLNVMEGFRGLYDGGPWASPYLFEPCSLLLSTDPVAMDRVAMEIIDKRRNEAGLPPIVKTGAIAAGTKDEGHLYRGGTHVEIAGTLGLGVYCRDRSDWERWAGGDPAKLGRPTPLIQHERIVLGAG